MDIPKHIFLGSDDDVLIWIGFESENDDDVDGDADGVFDCLDGPYEVIEIVLDGGPYDCYLYYDLVVAP